MRKRIFWILVITFIVLIGSLWIIEVRDKHALELAQTEAFATEALFEQANNTYELLMSYNGDEIQEKVKMFGVRSLKTADTLYLTTMGGVNAINENYIARAAFDGIRGVQNTLSKETLTSEDYNIMLSYLSQIEGAVEMTAKKLKTLEKKINNYWWK
ncbi:hypothetical protein HNQ94_000140 [Salirhabdus euzebyi]|uniref:Uncharacterized protein n=1 Tax=Salirhabdus euzebyi TaxID=394506 RepID=A0A841PSD3_9BACI|nr:hypothetical protein [Salirhabdus euzebyi]MBB6451719.1 hypothetical protein [Salirhabdus euzebyi]